MVGDLVGRPGRHAAQAIVPRLRRDHKIDLVIANGENAAGGRGLTPATAEEILDAAIDVITSGNHIWAQREIVSYLAQQPRVLRPLNYPPGTPGQGYLVLGGVFIVNIAGRVFMAHLDCPFQAIDRLLATVPDRPPVTIIDFHGEATSEKMAFAWHLDGRASAILGTHTHVPTADARVLPKGTAFVTDVGMVGPLNSVIGMRCEPIIEHFRSQMPPRLQVAEGPVAFNSVLVEIDEASGRALGIGRLDEVWHG